MKTKSNLTPHKPTRLYPVKLTADQITLLIDELRDRRDALADHARDIKSVNRQLAPSLRRQNSIALKETNRMLTLLRQVSGKLHLIAGAHDFGK